MQKIKNIHWVNPEKSVSQTDRQIDGLMNRSDFIGPFLQRKGLIMFFRNLRKNF